MKLFEPSTADRLAEADGGNEAQHRPLVAGPGAITAVITPTARATGSRVRDGARDVLDADVVELARRADHARGQRIFLRFMGLIPVSVGAQLLLGGVRSFIFPTAAPS